MRIKKLILENFKSFGGRHEIDLDYNFIAITGPNGSGKSNIVDAILFVLGTRSPKAIRTAKFSELIFNGGKTGSPANYCAVTIIFDNSESEIPDMPKEIEIKRMVRKSPKGNFNNYYYINGKRTTASEVESLLSLMGISQESMYNVVLQGDITRIALTTPKERTQLIAEISGIKVFEESIAEANTKLKEVSNTLNIAKSVLEEIKRRVDELKVERDKALKYLELKNKMRSLEKTLIHRKLEITEEKYRKRHDDLKKREKELEETKKSLENLNRELEAVIEEIRNMEKDYSLRSSKIDEIKNNIAAKRKEQNEILLTIEKTKSKISFLNREKEKRLKRIGELENEIEGLKIELGKLVSHEKELLEKVNSLAEELEKIEKRIKETFDPDFQNKLNELQMEISNIENDITRLSERKKSLEKIVQEKMERNKTIQKEIEKLQINKENIQKLLEERKKELEKVNFKMSEIYAELSEVQNEIELVESTITSLEQEIDALNKEYMKLEAKAGRPSEDEIVFQALKEAVRRGELDGIVGRVIDVIKIPEEYFDAVMVAGGSRLNAIITETDEDAEKAVEYLRKHKIGKATFLPLNKMRSGKPSARAHLVSMESGSYGFVKDLVEYDKKYEPAIWYAFTDTVVMENLRIARKYIGGVRIVTLSGDLIESSGAITGGYVKISKEKISKAKLELLTSSISEKRDELLKNRELLRQLNEKLKRLNSEYYRLRDDKEKLALEVTSLEERLKSIQETLSGYVLEDVQSLNSEIEEISKELDEKLRLKEELENKLEEIKSKINLDEYRKLLEEREIITKKIKELEKEHSEIKSELRATQKQIEMLEKEIMKEKEELLKIEKEIPILEKEIEDKESLLKEIREEIENLEKMHDEEVSKLSEYQQEYYVKKETKARIESEIERLKYKAEVLEDEIMDIKRDLEAIRVHIEDLKKQLEEYENVEIIPSKMTIDEIQAKIIEVKTELVSLEPVNMLAIEEYERERKRYEERYGHVKKLEEERKEIIAFIKDLEKRRNEKFLNVYRNIKKKLKEIYKELSGGGTVDLVLENSRDPLSGGILLYASPPGKKKTRIETLSGGERSLVALSLILAIQEVVPSPFYVFDEADMFLDAVNAENVGRMLKEKSKKSQFIVVSLRRPTIKYAEAIIGVTQPKKAGISKIMPFIGVSDAFTVKEDKGVS